MFYIVYKTTNNINGKYYIGVHKTNDLNDDYLGSGVALNASIKKYGREHFSREILVICESYESAFAVEKSIVTKEKILDPLCYNMTVGGEGSWAHIDFRGDNNPMRKSQATRDKVSASIKKTLADNPEERARRAERMSKMRKEMVGYKHSEETKRKISKSNTGKQLTAEQRQKISVKKLGKKDSEETRLKKKAAAQKRMADGFDMGSLGRGKKYKMSEYTCCFCGKTGKGGNMSRFHFDNCSFVPGAPKYKEPEPEQIKERKKIFYSEVECPHCGMIGKGGNMTRFHFDNCKKKVCDEV